MKKFASLFVLMLSASTVAMRPSESPARALRSAPIAITDDGKTVVTVNSDDPAYFGGYVADNYIAVRDGLEFTVEQFRKVAENSFRASFLDEASKARLLAELEAHFAE